MRDEVLTIFHALVEGQSEAPPVEEIEEYPEKINETTEVNTNLLHLIQGLHQQFYTVDTTKNSTNQGKTDGTPNTPNPCNSLNYSNPRNCRRPKTRK